MRSMQVPKAPSHKLSPTILCNTKLATARTAAETWLIWLSSSEYWKETRRLRVEFPRIAAKII